MKEDRTWHKDFDDIREFSTTIELSNEVLQFHNEINEVESARGSCNIAFWFVDKIVHFFDEPIDFGAINRAADSIHNNFTTNVTGVEDSSDDN
jgi:hypothetical protein